MLNERCDTAVGLFIARTPTAPGGVLDGVAAGCTIADLIAHAINKGALPADPDELDLLRVYLDGEPLPFATAEERAATLDVIPAATSVVNLQIEPAGGSNGLARSVLAVVLTAVAIVAAVTVGPMTAAIWSVSAAVVPNLLFPIKTPDSLASANDTSALNSSSNQIRRRGMMPLQFGPGRVPMDVAANPYSQMINGEVWLNVIFGHHYGPCSVADIKIGETLLADYPAGDVQVEHFLTPGPRDFTLYAQAVHQENLGDQLDLGGDYEVHTSEDEADRVEIDFTWPSGLRYNKENGSILQQETRLQIEWSPVGEDTWVGAPLDGGPYYSRLGALLPTGTVEVAARSADPVRRTFSWTKPNKERIKIRVRAWDPDADDASKAVQDVYWTALRTVTFKKPIVDEYLACTAMRIKSSDDLGGSLPTVTAIITPFAPKWTGTEWLDDIADWEATTSPVALARMMLVGPAAAKPWTADAFDSSCETVHDLIVERGWTGSYRLNTEVTQEDALKVLGAIGRFSVYDAGDGLCFVPDWEKPVARQLFTGRNAQGYSYSRSFPDDCHAVVVEFKNLDEDSQADERIVYADGYDASNATLIESYDLRWDCTWERAYREGRVWLAKRKLQVEAHQWTAGADAIRSAYGARVKVRHNTALYGQSEARVQFRRLAGGLVTGVRLDEPVEMVEGVDYALDVRRYDQLIPGVEVVTNPGRVRDLVFPVPLVEALAPEAGDLIAFGRVGAVTEDVEITDFQPQGDGTFQITGRRYLAAEIEAAETGEIPDLNTSITPKAVAPIPRLLGVTQASPDGVKIAFDIDEVRGALIESFPVRWRRASADTDENPWQNIAPLAANARLAVTPAFPDAVSAGKDEDAIYRVDVEIRSKLRSGDVSKPLTVANITINRGVSDPTGFSAVGAVRSGTDGSSYPVLYVQVDPVVSGMVQDLVVEVRPEGEDDTTWVSAGQPLASTNPRGDFTGRAPGERLDVRVQWRTSDNYTSNWLVELDVLIPVASLVASDTVKVGEFTAAQIKTYTELTDEAKANAENAQSRIDDAVAAAAAQDEVIAEHYEELTAGFAAAASSLAAEAITRASADSALSAYQVALAATVASNYSTLNTSIGTLTTQQSSTAAALTTLTSNFNSNVSSVSSQLTTLSSAQSSQASDISYLSSTVGGFSSSISTISTTLATLAGQVSAAYGVSLDVNGHVIGYQGINNGVSGGWIFRGDYFGITTAGGTKYPFFTTGGVVYLSDTVVDGDLLVNGSITFGKVGAGELTESSSVGDSTHTWITGSEEVCASISVYCAGGDIDIYSLFACSNYGDDADAEGRIYVNGSLLDSWPLDFRAARARRDCQMAIASPGVGWKTIELRATASSGGILSLLKIFAVLNIVNRRR